MPDEVVQTMPGEFGALLEEALGREPEQPARSEAGAATAVAGPDALDSSLVVAVTTRFADGTGVELAPEPAPLFVPTRAAVPSPPAVPAPPAVPPPAPAPAPEPAADTAADTAPDRPGISPVAGYSDLALTAAAPRPTTVDGHVEVDPEWLDLPLLQQPVVLRPGASIGSPGGGSYIANCGTIAVTFVPSGTGSDPSAGTFFVDPAEVAAAAGPAGVLTDEVMAQLSGQPYRTGPPTAVQMAIIDAARHAGLRFTPAA